MKNFLLYSIVAIGLCSCGATKEDYIKSATNNIKYAEKKEAESRYYNNRWIAEDLIKESNKYYRYGAYDYEQAQMYDYAAMYYDESEDVDSKYKVLKKLYDICENNSSECENLRYNELLADFYLSINNREKANYYYEKAAKYYERQQQCRGSIAFVGRVDKPEYCYELAAKYYEKAGNLQKLGETYLNAAKFCEDRECLTGSADKYYSKVQSVYSKIKGGLNVDEVALAKIDYLFKSSSYKNNNYQQALKSCENIKDNNLKNKCIKNGLNINIELCNSSKISNNCYDAGHLYSYLKDDKNALKYYYLAYDIAGDNFKQYGLKYYEKIRYNLEQFVKMLDKNCGKNNGNSCFDLGVIYHYDYKNYSKAIQVYTKACNLNHYAACNNLGFLYRQDYAVNLIDNKKSFELYTKACKGGEMIACSNIGGMYEQGKAVARNYNTAKSYYKKACNGGYKKACDFYNNLEANVVNVDSSDYSSRF